MTETIRKTKIYICLVSFFAALVVLWQDRKDIWNRIRDNARQIQAFILIILCVALVCVMGARIKLAHDQRVEAEQNAAAELMRLDLEKQEAIRASMVAAEQVKAQEAAAQHQAECEEVARVLYGTALHHSEEAQKAVVWCILNRVESSLYPDTVEAVCKQESQWMGYSEDNPIISGLYDVADEVLSYWRDGGYRPMSPDFLFLTWTRDEITLRTSYNETANTHYWRVK